MKNLFLYEICYYDDRNPDQTDAHEPKDEQRGRVKSCACDNCFYGRDALALMGIDLLATIKTAQRMLERDYIDAQKMRVIDKCREVIERCEVLDAE